MGRRIRFKGADEFIFTHNGIARAVGMHPSTLRDWMKREDITLSKTRGRVYMSKYMIPVMKRLYARSKVSKATPVQLKGRPVKKHKMTIKGEDYVIMKCSDLKKTSIK